MDQTVWEILGIEATTDERAIKRAYAARLKVTPPEVDAAGYMKLRGAYETAKIYAQFQRGRTELQPAAAEQPEQPAAAPLSAQQQAFADLHSLLERRELDAFLQKVASIQTAQTFTTLDETNDFIGEVACMVADADIQDSEWCGRLASLLGARDHENIFPAGTRYWYVYNRLLASYAQLRATAAEAHAEQQSDIAFTPGYLHVYHVLTGPFDAERLSALTRSQTYHRLAQQILERARVDPSIVISAENREWWDRTALTGQHRPAAEPGTRTGTAASNVESNFGIAFYVTWLILLVVILGVRGLPGDSSREFRIEQEKIKQLEQYNPGSPLVDYSLRKQEANTALDPRLALCDSKTRRAILLHLSVLQPNARMMENVDPNPLRMNAPPPGGLQLDTSDPIVASLLEKCDASKYFDSDGMLRKLPE